MPMRRREEDSPCGASKDKSSDALSARVVVGLCVLRPLQCKIGCWGSEKEDLVRGRTGEGELEEVVAFDLGFEAQVGLGRAESVGRLK